MTEEESKMEEQKTEETEQEEEMTETAEETVEEKAEEEETLEQAPEEVEPKEEEVQVPVEEKEEVKPPLREEKPEEEEIVEERIYTIPLGKAWIMPPRKRTPRAMRMIRAFITKHMKLGAKKEGEEEEEEPQKLIITNEVNEKVWERGVEKPPRKIRVRAAKDKDGNITLYLAEGD
ncbi:MAG TPA: 50S ribosomal protein L31e [candidate division Zixibacteria bacterium]|nr:50S ribosomal protein L31e [candidate division Zixibacteria bacterium]